MFKKILLAIKTLFASTMFMFFFPVVVLCGVIVYLFVKKDFKHRYEFLKKKISARDTDFFYDFWTYLEDMFPKKDEYSPTGYLLRMVRIVQNLISLTSDDDINEKKIKAYISNKNYITVENQNIKTFITNKGLLSFAKKSLEVIMEGYRVSRYDFDDGDSILEVKESHPKKQHDQTLPNPNIKLKNLVSGKAPPGRVSKTMFALSPNFSIEKKIDLLWTKYPDGIYIHRNSFLPSHLAEISDIDSDSAFSRESFSLESLKNVKYVFYGSTQARLEQFVFNVEKFRKNKMQRNYLLIGNPGTGKTTYALEAAKLISGGKRILKISAELFANFQKDEMDFILFFLKPYCIIIDDFDRVFNDYSSKSQDIMYFFESLKSEEFSNTTIFCTVNSLDQMGKAIIRPGRFDEILVFHLPKTKERREILLSFFKEFNYTLPQAKQLNQLVSLTDGFSQAYLREFCLECKYDQDFDHIINKIRITRQFISTEDFLGGDDDEVTTRNKEDPSE